MLSCEILRSETEIEAIADEWRALYASKGNSPFTDYDWFITWWRIIGRSNALSPHVVIGRDHGKLVGVLPLTVARRFKGVRVLQAAGQKSYYYCDMICEDAGQAAALWDAARRSPHYDFADIRDVYPESNCHAPLAAFAQKRDVIEAFFLRFKEKTGKEWMAALSGNTRGNFNRCKRRMEEKGALTYHVHFEGTPPLEPIDGLVKDKVAWCIKRGKPGLFEHKDVLAYFHEMTRVTAARGRLFLAWLQCGDKFIAYNLGLIHNKVLHMPFWTYDAEWAQWSPGNVIMVNTICWAIDQGLTGIDLRQGKSSFKVKYANETRDCDEFTFSNSLRGALLEKAFILMRNLYRLIKRGDNDSEDRA